MSAFPEEFKRTKQQTTKTKVKMETQRVTPIEERAEIVQDVIDRLLYLSPEEMIEYKQILSLMHRVYSVDVKIVEGIRIYSVNKNLQ